jgi:adenylate cyclase
MVLSVDMIRDCLDGAVPAVLATCAADGTPNATYISQVQFVDASHVALSFQFLNKTRENLLTNPHATVMVVHPETAARYRMALQYLRTETEGPLFESMKARLAGIASHTGMSGVFRLLGSDLYRVIGIERVPGTELPASAPRRNLLSALRTCSERLGRCTDLAGMFDELFASMVESFDIPHAMVLMLDAHGERLRIAASCGYADSGVGFEVPLGEGVIGIAGKQRTPIRITRTSAESACGRVGTQATMIPFPGLPDAGSRLALPVIGGGLLLGVLYLESPEDLRFGYDDEDALVAVAAQLGMAIHSMGHAADGPAQ